MMEPATKVALIADDDEYFRIALRVILTSQLGFTDVIQADSLDEAIEKLSENPGVALALFDLHMPGMKSAASLAAVKEAHPQLTMAVVSGSKSASDIVTALSSGMQGYVPKGLGASDVASALRQLMDGNMFVPKIHDEKPANENVPDPTVLDELSGRQWDVMQGIVDGLSNKAIGENLQIHPGTVKIHLTALYKILRVNNRAMAAVRATELLKEFNERKSQNQFDM